MAISYTDEETGVTLETYYTGYKGDSLIITGPLLVGNTIKEDQELANVDYVFCFEHFFDLSKPWVALGMSDEAYLSEEKDYREAFYEYMNENWDDRVFEHVKGNFHKIVDKYVGWSNWDKERKCFTMDVLGLFLDSLVTKSSDVLNSVGVVGLDITRKCESVNVDLSINLCFTKTGLNEVYEKRGKEGVIQLAKDLGALLKGSELLKEIISTVDMHKKGVSASS